MTDYTSGRSEFERGEDQFAQGAQDSLKSAKSAIDAGVGKVGEFAHHAAEKVGELAHDASGKVGSFAQQATEKLSATADYLRNKKMADMKADLESLVKRYPTQALVGALAIGFLAARAMRRD